MLSTDDWCIKVSEKVYGPYSTDQLQNFARQGRLGPQSLVAPAGGQMWQAARSYPDIAQLFHPDEDRSRAPDPAPRRSLAERNTDDVTIANFVIVFDTVSGAASRLEHIVRNLGPAFRLTDNVWAVSSDQTVMGLKNLLAPHLQIREPVFIVDTTRGKSVWQNFTPEKQAKLTKAWMHK